MMPVRRPSDTYEGQAMALKTQTGNFHVQRARSMATLRACAAASNRRDIKAMAEIFEFVWSILNGLPPNGGGRRRKAHRVPRAYGQGR